MDDVRANIGATIGLPDEDSGTTTKDKVVPTCDHNDLELGGKDSTDAIRLQ